MTNRLNRQQYLDPEASLTTKTEREDVKESKEQILKHEGLGDSATSFKVYRVSDCEPNLERQLRMTSLPGDRRFVPNEDNDRGN